MGVPKPEFAMTFNDAIVRARLGSHPELLARLYEFVAAYHLESRPALILQARARRPASIDLHNPEVHQALQAGAGDRNSWWSGFNTGTAITPTFHGIGAIPSREEPLWATEAHWDGHFMAGIWNFPEAPYKDKSVLAIADFFSPAFGDFFALIKKLTPGECTYDFTATLWQAPLLHYLAPDQWGSRHVVRADPLPVDTLQWPIREATTTSDDYDRVSELMGVALRSAYGDRRALARPKS
jgi:hypothetical protein